MELGTDGLGSVSASEVDNGSSDNCGALSLSLDQTDFDCDDIGVQQVILSVEDGSGNMASCISSVEVVDLLEPDLDCAISVSQQVENPGDSSVFVAIPIALASDNCGVIDIVNNYNAGGADASDIYSLGSTLVVYLAEDGNGNTESCTTEVIVFADSSVVAVCQNISVGLDSMGTLVVTGAEIDGGSFGGEGELTFFINGNTVLEFDCDDQGTIGVTLLVVDELGEEDDCTAEITIVDNISPVALCTNIELGLNEDGLASIIPEDIDAGSFDNCAIEGLEASQVSFDCDHIGGNHVELTVFDENGNSSSCSATVTIVDDVPPVLDCQDHELSLSIDGEASLTIADVLVMASDNCGIESFELSQSTFECTDIGENLVFLTASDDSGNTSTCEVEVVVFDDIPPAMNCTPMISQQVETPGDSTVFVSVMLVSATDNCIEVTVENNIGPGGEDASSIFFLGETEVVFIGTDGSGNQSSCTTIVNVIEDLTLVAVCSDLTIQLDEDGSAVLEADQLDAGSFGGIGELSFQINGGSEIAFDCSDIGLLSLTMVVSDEESNQDSCSSIVEIVDDLNPIALCQDITLYLNSSGNADLTVEEVDGGSSDNCEIVSYVLDQSNFNCDHLGENAVSLLVADGSGNTSSCVSEVTVLDTIFPDISCPEDVTIEIAEGETEGFVSLEEAMASDNCEILNIENNYNSNGEDASDIYELGQTVVVFTATDQSGNITECQTVVLVIPENIPSDEYQIGGNISTDFGVNINLVEMKVSGDESFSEFSDTDGNYSLTVQSGSEVTVAPEKNTNWLDGVTTLDLILIQRHLLGLELFDSPYKIIAADANDDGLVSTFDLVLLQILIIGNSDSLAGNTSWRFIPAEFEFADPGNPLAEFFPEFKEYPPLSQDWEEEDWVAIKVGDVSGDAGLSGMRISRATADFELNHQSDAGTHHLVLTAAEDMNLSGFQMEWSVSEDIYIERVDMQYSILPRLNVDFYNFDTQTNLLKVNWWSADAQTVSKGDEIFRLELIGEVDPMVAISALSLVSAGSLWQSEIYLNSSSGLEIRHPRLIAVKFSERKTQNKLFQNEPNPFDQLTAIPFFTVEEGPVKLEIFDRSGLEIKSIDISALAGMNRFYLDLSSLPGGVYFYRLSSKNGDWRESLRMIKVEK
ncbi:MAG: HYR domain-containing protein [Saprospirales bacterium]|nr:MAG: HYR domain-containing protein [Saprospirales bacterium]